MPAINKLSASQVRAAKFEGRVYKLQDGGGLILRVRKSGADWVFRYRWGEKRPEMVLGRLQTLSLAEARRRRDDYRRLIDDGIDPIEHRRQQAEQVAEAKAESERTLESVLLDWMNTQQWSDGYRATVLQRLRRYVFPRLGARPIVEITAPEVLAVLRKAEDAGKIEVAPRCRQYISAAYGFAIASGWVDHDPAAGLVPALKKRPPTKHRAAILDPVRLGELLRAVDARGGQPQVKAALQLLPLVMTRPVELRLMEWSELDMEEALWSIPAKKMKMRQDHLVPLSRQAVLILEGLRHWTGHRKLVFPSLRDANKPISENTMNAAFRGMGYDKEEVTAHGFRATGRTLIAERLRWPAHIIELALAHAPRDPLGRAYNRAEFLDDRREMLQEWADYLDKLRKPGVKSA